MNLHIIPLFISFPLLCACDLPRAVSDQSAAGGGLFAAAELPDASEVSSLYSWAQPTVGAFNAAKTQPLSPPVSTAPARYEGSLLARKGTGTEFLSGEVQMRLDFANGDGFGQVENMTISGSDTLNRQLDLFSTLDIAITSINSAEFGGRITGTAEEDIASPSLDNYTIDAALDGRFVDGGAQNEIVGTIEGTITSGASATQSLSGVMVAEQTN